MRSAKHEFDSGVEGGGEGQACGRYIRNSCVERPYDLELVNVTAGCCSEICLYLDKLV